MSETLIGSIIIFILEIILFNALMIFMAVFTHFISPGCGIRSLGDVEEEVDGEVSGLVHLFSFNL